MAKFTRKSMLPTVDAIQIKHPSWLCEANAGWWLVEDEHGQQQILSDTAFKRHFERV